jgi:DNA replication protein DnaC
MATTDPTDLEMQALVAQRDLHRAYRRTDEPRKPEMLGAAMPAFEVPKGPFPCVGCGTEIEHFGICGDCNEGERTAEHEATNLRFARRSIPERFQWASFDVWDKETKGWKTNELLDARVSRRAIGDVRSLFGKPMPKGVVLVGEAGRGKTTLACAILRRIHDSAPWDAAWKVVDRASRAFFVSAPELLDAWDEKRKGEPTELMLMARNASVLVLDDVRQGRPEDPIDRIVFRRHNLNRPTIVTTWMEREQALTGRGDGFARRLYGCRIEV